MRTTPKPSTRDPASLRIHLNSTLAGAVKLVLMAVSRAAPTGSGSGPNTIAPAVPQPTKATVRTAAPFLVKYQNLSLYLRRMPLVPLLGVDSSRSFRAVTKTKPLYIASDVHYGAAPPSHQEAFLRWLEHAASVASGIIINGDLFDFWFEYQWGTTRGNEPLLEQIRSAVDSGIPITLMGGNHDWWGGRYLREEVGIEFLDHPVTRDLAGHCTLVAHGDGLGTGDAGYRAFRALLRSPYARFGFSMLPVRAGDSIAKCVSNTKERWDNREDDQDTRSNVLEAWAVETLRSNRELDLVLLGHTHRPLVREPEPGRWYVNSGDWVVHQSYVILKEGEPPQLLDWRKQ